MPINHMTSLWKHRHSTAEGFCRKTSTMIYWRSVILFYFIVAYTLKGIRNFKTNLFFSLSKVKLYSLAKIGNKKSGQIIGLSAFPIPNDQDKGSVRVIFFGRVRVFSKEYQAYIRGLQGPVIILNPVNDVLNHAAFAPLVIFNSFSTSHFSSCSASHFAIKIRRNTSIGIAKTNRNNCISLNLLCWSCI